MTTLPHILHERRKDRKKTTGEDFTPLPLVNEIIDRLSKESNNSVWQKDKTFIDPAAGNGNFLIEVLRRKLDLKHDPTTALSTIYGTELMRDNVEECRERLLNVLKERNIKITREMIETVFTNIICTPLYKYPRGSLDYDFSFDGKNLNKNTINEWFERFS